MKRKIGSVIILGSIMAMNVCADDTMKYFDMAVTKLIKNQKQITLDISTLKQENVELKNRINVIEDAKNHPQHNEQNNLNYTIGNDIREFIFDK